MEFKPRFTIPEQGNRYYNRYLNGGYGTSIQGYPPQKGLTVLANCVGYAAARFNEIGDYGEWRYWNYPPNAEQWWAQAKQEGLKTGQEPKLGAVAVWEGVGSKAGHVAIVEQIGSDGSIITSESGYGSAKPFWTQHRVKGSNGNWGMNSSYRFTGFVYHPIDFSLPPQVRSIKRSMKGEDVKAVQKRLIDLGYLRAGEDDGDFGVITFGAVLAFQFDNKLELDGVVGPKTKQKLKLNV